MSKPSLMEKWKEKTALGTFGISLLLHAAIFLLIGSYVMFEGVVPRSPFVSSGDLVAPDTEYEMEVPDIMDEMPVLFTEMPMEMTTDSSQVDAGSPMDLIVSTAPSMTFSMPAPTPGAIATGRIGRGGSGSGSGPSAPKAGRVFGGTSRTEQSLEGILYDTKQSPTGADQRVSGQDQQNSRYQEIIRDFVRGDWQKTRLSEYFSAERRLYADQFFFPLMAADAGPKEFGVEAQVKPMHWFVHYQGTVVSGWTGRARLVGRAGEVAVVRLDDKIIFDGSHTFLTDSRSPGFTSPAITNWSQRDRALINKYPSFKGSGRWDASETLVFGDWVDVREGTGYDLEVLVGERGGGDFYAFIMFQRDGMDSLDDVHETTGVPKFPVWRTNFTPGLAPEYRVGPQGPPVKTP